MSSRDFIPPLAKIALHVSRRRSFDESVNVMPVVGRAIVGITPKRRRIAVQMGVPAIIVTVQLDEHVDAADKGMGSIYDHRLLMK